MRVKLAIALSATILTVAALEIGFRLYLSAYGDERQKTLYLYSREEIQERQTLYRGLAYLNYGLAPTHDEINSLGYRGPEITLPKPSGVFRIVALGGSTTYGAHLHSWRDAYPHQLQKALRQTFAYDEVEVINAGVPGYSSWESLVNLMLRIPDLEADMVIVYHALNDVSARLVDPEFYGGLNVSRGFWMEHSEPLPGSVLYRFALKRLGFEITAPVELPEQFRLPDDFRTCGLDISGAAPLCGKLNKSVDEVLASNPPIYFERNLHNMALVARESALDIVLLTWAYSPLDFEFPGSGLMQMAFRQEAIDEHNEIVRGLAREHDTGFYDLAASMPTDSQYFFNGVHMTVKGAAEMARQLAEYLAASGRLDG